MNWFQRYGIPGAYFVVLLVTGLYALYPGIVQFWDRQTAVGLALLAFLPVGYVISIFIQWRYLVGFGTHRAAMDRLRIPGLGFPDDPTAANEGIIEARTLLLVTLHTNAIPLDAHKFIRDWNARRYDVIAINRSIIAANILAFAVFVLAFFFSGIDWRWPWVFAPLIVSVILIMWLDNRILRNQIIEVIAGVYRRHRNDGEPQIIEDVHMSV